MTQASSGAQARAPLARQSRYTTIIVSIALFLVFDLGVLVLNFYVASAIKKDAEAVNVAGRQRMLSQRMVKNLLQLQNDLDKGRDGKKPLAELQTTTGLFDSTLYAFRDGGDIKGTAGAVIPLPAVKDPAARQAVDQGVALWQPYSALLKHAIGGGTIDRAALAKVIDYANATNLKLLKVMNDLTNDLQGVAASKARTLRYIQAGGITLALINFGIILFHFLRNLRQADERIAEYSADLEDSNRDLADANAEIKRAQQQTDQIMDTVGEGLFLLDREGRIGEQHSRELAEIFPQQRLGGMGLLELLGARVENKTWEMTRDFLKLLFQRRLKEKMLINVNPLDEVEVYPLGGAGDSRILSFSFNRVQHDDEIEHVLVTVRDISARVRLQQELAASRAQAKEQVELMFGILHVEPARLREFLQQTEQRLDGINSLLRDTDVAPGQLRQLVDRIFREMHAVKGDAGLLGLDLFQDSAHRFEDKLNELRALSTLTGPDFVGLTIDLNDLRRLREETWALVERVAGLGHSFSGGRPALSGLVGELQGLVSKLGADLHKQALVQADGFDPRDCEGLAPGLLRDVLIQLTRNAMAHGIEPPEQRAAGGKRASGLLQLSSCIEQGYLLISLRDDGQGLRLDRIRARAIEAGLLSADEAETLPRERLAAMIFRAGFSTSADADQASGRGVGMDIVRSHVAELGGRIRLSYSRGRSCEFRLQIPLPGAEQSQTRAA